MEDEPVSAAPEGPGHAAADGTGRSRLPRGAFELGLALLGSLVLLLVVAPLLGLALSGKAHTLSAALGDREVLASIELTLSAAAVATLAGTVAGVPLAYLLARRRFTGRAVLLALIDLPVVVPHSAAGIALLTVMGRRSALGGWLEQHGLSLVGGFGGIAVAMAFVSVPFVMSAAREGFEAVPQHLEHAARTLGAGPARTFFTISLPLGWRPIVSGMALMWGRGISEFGAVLIIAYHPMVTPILVYQRFSDYGLGSAQAVALLLVAICVVLLVALRLLARQRQEPPRA